ncbi:MULTISPECIES: hypothetical protein [unclassified Endozoicomonas]|uniref:hypothetical protein n=1 Tax=unclassified Endozoicomonas TaxID=2644528 RepID=UPI003BB77461
MVTASHNPKNYNGMKLVRVLSKPISGDTGLRVIQGLAEEVFVNDLFPSSDEINTKVENPQAVIERVLPIYEKDSIAEGHTGGISLDKGEWRFNLRISNTEPVFV